MKLCRYGPYRLTSRARSAAGVYLGLVPNPTACRSFSSSPPSSYPTVRSCYHSPNPGGTTRRHSTISSAASSTPSSPLLPSWSRQPKAGDTVYIAMSGGVDSSVVALLLSRASHPLTLKPIYMRNWSTLEESPDFQPGAGGAAGCGWQREYQSVQAVCAHLNLDQPRLMDLSREYWRDVFSPSLDHWAAGLTPNPDVLCNREIKFGALLDRIIPPSKRKEELATSPHGHRTWLATGHYAKLIQPASSCAHSKEVQLHRAIHRWKDQSYFLSSVPASTFAHALFPLAELYKDDVRRIAREFGLPTADKKESMGLCFVGKRGKGQDKTLERRRSNHNTNKNNTSTVMIPQGEGNKRSAIARTAATFGDWLSSYLPTSSPYTSPGPFLALDGTVLGQHDGLHTITIGQGARLGGCAERCFVARKEIRPILIDVDDERSSNGRKEETRLQGCAIVVPGTTHPLLFCKSIEVPLDQFHWVASDGPPSSLISSTGEEEEEEEGRGRRELHLLAQVRHRSDELGCRVSVSHGGTLKISFSFDSDSSSLTDDKGRAEQKEEGATKSYERSLPRAVCPGQVVALYDGPRCLGSAVVPEGGVRLLGEEEGGGRGGE